MRSSQLKQNLQPSDTLPAYQMLISGALIDGANELPVINPATGEAFCTVAAASADQAEEAIRAAKSAFPAWAATPLAERQQKLNELADALHENAEDFARVLVQEQGKPLPEATAEVAYTEGFLRYFAAATLKPETIQDDDDYRIELHYKPLGVVVGIAPWNLPLLIGANKLGPALVTGNSVILKPAPTTPVTSLMLGALAKDIFPPGVINIVTGNNDLGPIFTAHPDVAKITFTGSTATGKKVAQSAVSSLKRLTLELGGNDAGIVLDDVDVQEVAPKIFGGAFLNCGQVCIALKRLYVHESQYDEMCSELSKLAEETVVGNGLDDDVTIGPLQNSMQFEKAKEYLNAGRTDGTIAAGGELIDGPGYFMRPTIVSNIKEGSRLVDEEQFAPILPIIKYSNLDDVIERANNSEYGLGGSVWSSDVERAKKVAAAIDSGTIWINHHLHFGPHIPFGGAKESGIGVEFGKDGIAEFTQRSVISIANG